MILITGTWHLITSASTPVLAGFQLPMGQSLEDYNVSVRVEVSNDFDSLQYISDVSIAHVGLCILFDTFGQKLKFKLLKQWILKAQLQKSVNLAHPNAVII